MDPPEPPAYHERQRLHQCLRHTLNNMFQTSQFSSGELDAIADALAPGRLPLPFLHPHRTLWFGNYDVNVMDVALRRHGKELRWHDLRDSTFERLELEAAFALVLNVQTHNVMGRLLGGRHWLALRRIGGRWWNLDSKLGTPRLVAQCCFATKAAEGEGAAGALAGQPDAATASTDAACSAAAGSAAAGANGAVAAAADGAAAAGEGGGEAAAGAAASDERGGATGAAAPGEAEQAAGEVAADEAAVRRFLMEQVRQCDAKVFLVVDCPLESHPLPDSPDDAPAVGS